MVELSSNSNNLLIKDYFVKNLSTFMFKSETSYGPYWGVVFIDKDVEIEISGDIGFGVVIRIGGDSFQLWQYDKNVIKASKTTNENILYQLNTLKSFLEHINT